jgi:hypothetical protein
VVAAVGVIAREYAPWYCWTVLLAIDPPIAVQDVTFVSKLGFWHKFVVAMGTTTLN